MAEYLMQDVLGCFFAVGGDLEACKKLHFIALKGIFGYFEAKIG